MEEIWSDGDIILEEEEGSGADATEGGGLKRSGPDGSVPPPAKRRKVNTAAVGDDADDATSTRSNDVASPREEISPMEIVSDSAENSPPDAFACVPLEIFEHIFSFFDERTRMRVQRVNRTWHLVSWQSRTQLDFGEWTIQPQLEDLLDFVNRMSPQLIRKIVFMDVSDINKRLEVLTTLRHLQTLSVSTCNALDVEGMKLIGAATSLSTLEMHRCGKEVPEHTSALVALTNLTRLDVGLIGRMADESLEFLTALQSMQILEISRCRRISAAGLRYISGLTQLRSLDMTSCGNIDSNAMACLSDLRELESLRIARCVRIGDSGLLHLNNLTKLKHLDMRSIRITNIGMSIFTALTKLESVDLKRCLMVGDEGVRQMTNLVNLRTLVLAKCHEVSASGLKTLSKLTNLVELDLSSCRIDDGPTQHDDGMSVLEFFSSLQKLKASDCQNFTAECLQWVNPDTLRELHLERCLRITDVGFSHLSKFTNLVTLNVTSNYLGNFRLRHLAPLTSLENLMIQACQQIDDKSITCLCSLQKLRFLDLGYCNKITDDGISHLSVLTGLRTLYLTQCDGITARGIRPLRNVAITQ
eukprot:TRINITY_DN13673_c0_g1_i1.p1 TRINITY_DN13673_c0_g1~~TRINITY_DN13673_c0_g1_i1.p1  ORF type:complete len:586 (-),score=101.13 TRINITY_DN13673_c0_g1_i1:162-1919(-)